MRELTFLSPCCVPSPMLGVLHMLSHLVLTEILKVGGISRRWGSGNVNKCSPGYPDSKSQSRNLSTVYLSSCATPSCLPVRWGHKSALFCSISGLGQRPCPFPKCSPGERKEFCPLKAGLILFLSLCLAFVLMGLYCTSLQLVVSWDRNYRWNHSSLTFGNIGQSLLPWSPGLTPSIAWSTWAVSQSLKGFLLYRHLCLNGMCRDGIWAV